MQAEMQAALDKVLVALGEFCAGETFLFAKDLGERSLRLPHGTIVSTDDQLGKSVYPDIVVHQREVPDNLLAIEVRKAANHQPPDHDRHKLRAMTDPHVWVAYRIGLLRTLGKRNVTSAEIYIGGLPDQPLSGWLAGRLKEAGLAAG